MTQDKIVWVNGRAYSICYVCEKMIQLNKFFLGSLHFCDTEKAKEMGIKI